MGSLRVLELSTDVTESISTICGSPNGIDPNCDPTGQIERGSPDNIDPIGDPNGQFDGGSPLSGIDPNVCVTSWKLDCGSLNGIDPMDGNI